MLSVYELSSPNGQLVLTVENGRVLQYSLSLEGRSVIHPSDICMTMQNGNIWGKNGEVVGMVIQLYSGCIMKEWHIVFVEIFRSRIL